MKLKLICVGKLKDYKDKIDEYSKRINHYSKFEVLELKDSDPKAESKKILEKIGNEYVIVLSEEGKNLSSVEFANTLQKINKDIVFIIGGPYGIDDSIRKKADLILSLSKMTFPHDMARLVFIEQLYRAHTIMKNEKYHK